MFDFFEFTTTNKYKAGGQVARVEATPEELEVRWDKKKGAISTLANSIRSLKNNVTRDLSSDNEKEALTALIIAIMMRTSERIGNVSSSEDAGHFGVVYFRKKHFDVDGNSISISYVGKSGVSHEKSFSDERIATALKKAIKNSPDKYVFTTSDGFKIPPERVNRYLSDFQITGKDIRGFSANDGIVKGLNKIEFDLKDTDEKKRQKLFNVVARKVAERIGHGIGTLKKHYMLPELEENFVKHGKIINLSDFYLDGGEIKK